MIEDNMHFKTWDYVIFGATLFVSMAIGLFYALKGGRQQTTAEYHLGDRKMKVLPVAISLLVSFQSAVLLLGLPAEMYVYGSQYWLYTLMVISANVISALLFAPLFHPLGLTSSYEYFELRFQSRAVRLLASFLGIMSSVWYSAIVLYGPAITLQIVTGFSVVNSIVLVGIVGLVYTAIGGIKAVIWTDAIQFVLMVCGMLAVLIQACIKVGGMAKAWEICEDGGRINFFNFDMNPTVRLTFWGILIGGTVKKMGFNLSQAAIQRISTVSTVSRARWMILLAIPGFILFGALASLQGLVAYAYFDEIHCDPLQKYKLSSNQLIPYFVMTLFSTNPGLPGLFLSSIFSASLSTYSSNLNCISAQVWEDFIKPHTPNISDLRATLIAKSCVLVFGAISIGLSFLIMNIKGPLTQIAISVLSSFGSTLTGLFLLGAFFIVANKKGAIVGGTTAFIFVLWLSMGSNLSPLVPKAPKLPSPGIDGCTANFTPILNVSLVQERDYTVLYSDGEGYNTTLSPITTTHSSKHSTSGLGTFYSISFMWFDSIGILVTLILGLIVSFITDDMNHEVEPRLLIPTIQRLCPCLPYSKNQVIRASLQPVPLSTDTLVSQITNDVNTTNQITDDHRVNEESKLAVNGMHL